MPEGGRRGGADAAKQVFRGYAPGEGGTAASERPRPGYPVPRNSGSNPLERRRVTSRGVAQAGRHGIEQRADGAAHRQHAGDDEDGDEGHDQSVLDGVGAALVAKKGDDVVLIYGQHVEPPELVLMNQIANAHEPGNGDGVGRPPGCWRGEKDSHPRSGFASDEILAWRTFSFPVVFKPHYSK